MGPQQLRPDLDTEKGATIKLTEDNLPIYERPIRAYEGNTLEVKEDGIYINGKKTDEYTFKWIITG